MKQEDMSFTERFFYAHFTAMQEQCHRIATDHGWHDKPVTDGEVIALMHSELSEALEWHRHGNDESDHIPEFSGVEEELADTVIRIMDYAQEKGFDVAGAIVDKARYNYHRPYKHGGKKF